MPTNNQISRGSGNPDWSNGDLAAFNLGMQLFQQPQIKKRHHRREVQFYDDHRTIIEEITEEF